MSWKENVVQKNDAERYKIAVPFKFLFGKKRQKYISSELEKCHPCFTDDFGFDSILTLKHGKPALDVVVAKKIKLEENSADFKKRKFIYAAGFIFFTICFLLGIFIMIFNHRADRKKTLESNEKEVSDGQINLQDFQVFTKPSGPDFCDFLFELVRKNKGRIREFSLKYDGFTEIIEVFTTGIYPEQISEIYQDLFISPVSYESELPVFKCKYKGNVKIDKKLEPCDIKNFLPQVREVLNQNNVEIIEESINPLSFRFNYGDLEKILKGIDFICEETDVGITEFDIAENQKTILFDRNAGYCDGIKLKSICDNIKLFEVSGKTVKKNVITEKEHPEMKVIKNISKVGEVNYPDGRKIIYYKDLNGKLIKEQM